MSERLIPHCPTEHLYDLGAEQNMIKLMLHDNSIIDIASCMVCVDDYFDSRHQILAERIYALAERVPVQRVDFLTLKDELLSLDLIELVGGLEYLEQFATEPDATFFRIEEVIRLKSMQRKLLQAARTIYDHVFKRKHPYELLDHCEKTILQVRDRRNVVKPKQLEVELHNLAELDADLQDNTKERRITGLKDLDRMMLLGGSQLIVLAANTSVGKTTLGLQLCTIFNKDFLGRMSVFIVSMEMKAHDIASRLVAASGNVTSEVSHFMRVASPDESQQLAKVITELSKVPIYVCDSGYQTTSTIAAQARRLNRVQPLGLIIVDYLQLVGQETKTNRTRADDLSEVSADLKRLSSELNCPVIVISQLNCGASGNEEPQLSHLKECGSIEQDADMVWFLWRESLECSDPNVDQHVFLKVAKNRHGPVGTIKLIHRKEFVRLDEIVEA